MTQKKIIDAYRVIERLCDLKMRLKTSYDLFLLKRKLLPYFEFQKQEEVKFLMESNGTIENDSISFETQEDYDSFMSKVKDLWNVSIDIDIKPIDIHLDEEFEISVNEIDIVKEFINFV